MKINGKEVIGKSFAYDNCHKIYVLEDGEVWILRKGSGKNGNFNNWKRNN